MRASSRRRVGVWAAAGAIVLGLVAACVGADPSSTSTTAADGGADSSTPLDAATAQDAGGQDSSSAADAADAGPTLPNVGAGHLQLWLTADKGVTCTANQVTTWADQSGKGHTATSGSHTGPQCPPAGHALNGINLPYFSSPGGAPFADESLDVNLSFLDGTDFTVFVVERRWKDRTFGGGDNNALIGTDPPVNGACPDAADTFFFFGYSYYDGFPALNYEPLCGGTRGGVSDASTLPPSPTVLDMLRLEQDAGTHALFQNGVKVNGGGTAGRFSHGLVGGAIGRAGTASESRFQGDIAEVVIFDTALGDTAKQQMEAYFKAHWNLP